MSSIGGDATQTRTAPAQPSKPSDVDAKQRPTQVQKPASNDTDNAPPTKKRKAEDGLQGRSDKMAKNVTSGGRPSHEITSIDRRFAKETEQKNPGLQPSKGAMPYRGTDKSNPPSDPSVAARPSPPAQVESSTKVPKKGSYAEIMARAKASQSKAPAVGVINHKPKDKNTLSYKKEMKLKKKAIKNKKLGIKDVSRPGSSGSISSNPAPASSDKRKAPQPAYKGTAKPKEQPTYKGTMNSNSGKPPITSSRKLDSQASRRRVDEYAATDEEDLDDVEEDDYGSEESDDMEAGFSDVEQEESAASKAARKEDEEEAKLEARLKKEKEERKKRLEAMAKKAKPQRY